MADWGSMFEASGEEEPHAAWVYFTRAGRLKPGVYYGTCKAFAVTLNYVLGLGCLGIPYAFYKAGISFSIIVTIFAAFLSMLSTMWIVEVHMRAMLVDTGRRHERAWSEQHAVMPTHHLNQPAAYGSTTTATITSPTFSTPKRSNSTTTKSRKSMKSPAVASQLTELLTSPNFFASTENPIIEVAEVKNENIYFYFPGFY